MITLSVCASTIYMYLSDVQNIGALTIIVSAPTIIVGAFLAKPF